MSNPKPISDLNQLKLNLLFKIKVRLEVINQSIHAFLISKCQERQNVH